MRFFTKLLVFTVAGFVLLFLKSGLHAQAPDWQWVKSAGGNNTDQGRSIAVDAGGNVYVAGLFDSPALAFDDTTLVNAGNEDMFIVKYDNAGNMLWARHIGGSEYDEALTMAIDGSGNVLVAGFINGLVWNSWSGCDAFVVKYSPDGNLLWTRTVNSGGNGFCQKQSITADNNGNVYVAGKFNSPYIIFGNDTITQIDGWDLFIFKYDANGNMLWAKSEDASYDRFLSVAADINNNFYITGKNGNSFLSKYDPNGNILWEKSRNYCDGSDVNTDADGNVYVTGQFWNDSVTFGTYTLSNKGGLDVFTVKYDVNGNVQWAASIGGEETNGNYGEETSFSIAADMSSNVYVAGYFESDSITIDNITLSHNPSEQYNMYFVKYDANGNVVWAKSNQAGIINSGEYGLFADCDAVGNVYISGFFQFNFLAFGSDTLVNANGYGNDVFVAKLGRDNITAIAEQQEKETALLNVYPNPFSTLTTLQTANPLHNATLTVGNCLGQTVTQIKNINGQTISFNRDNLLSGLYFMRLTQDNKVIAADKLIIIDK